MGAEAPMLVGADAPRPARQASPEALAGEGSSDRLVAEGSRRQVGYDSPRQVGYDLRDLAGDDAAERQMPPTDPDERQPLIRWRLERPGQGWRDGDQRSAFSRWAEDRQSLREHDADGVEDASEMERQVRDQLYGPGFRRR